MKFIKRFFIGLFLLLIVALIAGLFMKKDYHIERNVTIDAQKDKVFDYIKYLKNQDNYSFWNKQDPEMTKNYTGNDGEVGFVSSWVGNDKVGTGEQEIIGIKEGDRLDLELRFKKPYKMSNSAYMTTDAVSENQTKVTWAFDGKMNYPMNVMMPIINMDKMLGDQLQAGLNDLKIILEKIQTEKRVEPSVPVDSANTIN
ncbi:MAG: SRPBCC family protein [Saprospiraceae bacterium]|jgi:hypothetical protein|uniref:SRPBCC family protein n=1 Tax=Candidatus Brachybacter algidus TaxID=2982024 RepID=UPI001B74857C|nr:SRPBCC family protein [Candidatus Brachybacter algidus]MBP7306780.1 SRPBCC family protein [Saprospiraceae bacterium]MBK6372786.1 SRPBCC family protein [Candidatus Brachybacter algidus]MBK6448241.1 SRPBCC family protein [Candidatus Brachybacter algidus]MBK8354272.1 SRPBCC family protein [Candidatus Brachybacter algidus]MBK9553339.1 SRPBCC family protein [Candidatus Brachybacter algidus]